MGVRQNLKFKHVGIVLLAAVSILAISILLHSTNARAADRAEYADGSAACKKADIKASDGNVGPCIQGYTKGSCDAIVSASYKAPCEAGMKLWDDTHPTTAQPTVDQPQPTPAPTPQPQVQAADTAAQPDTSKSSCAIEKMGWILCPVIETGAKMSDWAFDFLASWFLEVPTSLFDNKSPTFTAWEQARNLANIAFIIAFLVLVYSQITGGIMSNYGIKRMLPRLIIAAIAVNVSYYICQIMVDLSNLLGYSIKDAFDTWAKDLPQVLGSGSGAASNTTSNGVLGGLTGIAIKALAVAGAVWALVGLLTGAIGGILGVLLFILILLLLRKAFIILLIVVSPLAFVAYLLPNTEKYYKEWVSAFTNLLVVFPIVALLMGSGRLASGIILEAGTEDGAATSQAPRCPTPQPTKPTGIDKALTCNPNSTQVAVSHSPAEFKLADLRAQSHGVILAANNCATGSVVTNDATGNPSCGPSFTVGTNRHASLGLGIAAAVIQVVTLAAVIPYLRQFMKKMGGGFAELSQNLERGSMATGGAHKAGKEWLKNTKFGKFREEKRQIRNAEIGAGTYSGPGGFLGLRSARTRMNRRLNKTGLASGYFANRDLTAQALQDKDTKDTMAMLRNDDTLAKAWAVSGGNLDAVDINNEHGETYRQTLEKAQIEQFNKMRGKGLHTKGSSFLAASQFLSQGGYGNGREAILALQHAKQAGASSESVLEGYFLAEGGYRNAGRGDAVGTLRAFATAQQGLHYDIRDKRTNTASGGNQVRGVQQMLDNPNRALIDPTTLGYDMDSQQMNGFRYSNMEHLHKDVLEWGNDTGTEALINYLGEGGFNGELSQERTKEFAKEFGHMDARTRQLVTERGIVDRVTNGQLQDIDQLKAHHKIVDTA